MSDQSASSHLKVLFEAALQNYERQTGIPLAQHRLTERLQDCHSVDSITAVLHEQTRAFNEFRGKEKVLKLLKNAVSVLHKLSASAKLGEVIGLKPSPVEAIHSGLAIFLSAIKGVKDSYDALVELLETIEHFLSRLNIYTKITPTVAMTEILVKILVELLSTLASATKEVRQGKPKKFVKKLFGENYNEAVLQRLNRLTQDEAKLTAAQILEVVHGLVQNMRVVTDDGKASLDCVQDALETMNQIASNMNKMKRDKLERDVREWLSPPDPWKNHSIARRSQHGGTAKWFVQGDEFSAWKSSDPSSHLWIHGKPGAGKSILCSSIIQDIMALQKAGMATLAFFYCDFREDQKRDLRGLLSSLLVQLCHQSDSYSDILFKFYSEHADGSQHAGDDELARCLTDLLKLPGQAPVYVIIDALDEFPNTSAVRSPRAEVLNLIEQLINSQFPNLRICVTSRPEMDIKDVLNPLTFRSVSLHDEDGQKRDIEDYIKSVIYTHRKNRRWKAEHKRQVVEVLTERAHGMFRWVDCQLAYICGCMPARIQHALADLPETLDGTYQRILQEINKADWELAHRLFQFVAVASRPLRVEELAELLAFDFKAGPIPKFREDWRLEDPVDAVLSTCSSLLAVVDVRGSPIIQFSHFSVKEFLTSARLAETSDVIHRRYHVSMTTAHALASQACLGTLLHLDRESITRDCLEDYRFAEYAAEHWVYHVRFEEVSEKLEDGMKQLFDPNRSHLTVCIWIHNPEHPFSFRPERPPTILQSPLHYAALWGLHSMVHFLVIKYSQDVSSRRVADNATPLHLASRYGNKEAACVLLEYGADASAQRRDNFTPLHLAVQEGHMDIAYQLIERGANVSVRSALGDNPLWLALRDRRMDIAHMLIQRGADVSARDGSGKTSLRMALQEGQGEIAHMLIKHGADVSEQDDHGDTPLHVALQTRQWEIAHKLIELGVNVSAHGKYGNTPLHLASKWGQMDIAHKLIAYGAEVSAQNKFRRTSLHLASESGNVEVVHNLIQRGADISAQDNRGDTPLHYASSDGHMDIVQMLIGLGADISAPNKYRDTPLHKALRRMKTDIAHKFIGLGADVSAQAKNGYTPLHLASLRGYVDIAHKLIERGADISAQDKDGYTPLHVASRGGGLDITHKLIECGADVSAQDKLGDTPLHVASQRGYVEVAHKLIEHGAIVTALNKNRKTPLHLLSESYWSAPERLAEGARILLEHGASVTAQDNDGLTPLDLASRGRSRFGEVAHVLAQHSAGPGAYLRGTL